MKTATALRTTRHENAAREARRISFIMDLATYRSEEWRHRKIKGGVDLESWGEKEMTDLFDSVDGNLDAAWDRITALVGRVA